MPGLRRALTGLLLLGAVRPALAQDVRDPLEAVNRRVHWFNSAVQAHVLGPAAEFYRATAPAELRTGVANAFANLGEPLTAVSGLLAGELDVAANAMLRFSINSTFGIAGIQDRAASLGYPRQGFTAADALCRWGVPSGPFVVLPLLGPSTLRDAGAMAVTTVALSQALGSDYVMTWSTGSALAGYAELHPELRRIEAQALDSYAVYRSLYLQQRAATCASDRVMEAETE